MYDILVEYRDAVSKIEWDATQSKISPDEAKKCLLIQARYFRNQLSDAVRHRTASDRKTSSREEVLWRDLRILCPQVHATINDLMNR